MGRVERMLAVVCLAASACKVPVELPSGAERLSSPPVYRTWWALTEACSGISGSFERIEWYRAPLAAVQAGAGTQAGAYYDYIAKRVVVAEDFVYAGRVVRHEMLHALRGHKGHPAKDFLDACGGVVDCPIECVEAPNERLPQEGLAVVPPESLAVELVLDPPAPNRAIDGGHFRIIATVRNPLRTAIRTTVGDGFALELVRGDERLGGPVPSADPRLAEFAGGEQKRMVFDLALSIPRPRLQLSSGNYVVRVRFGTHWSASRVLSIPP